MNTLNLKIAQNKDSFLLYICEKKEKCIKCLTILSQKVCSIVIGSWMLDTSCVDFTSDNSKIDTSTYFQHPVWYMKSVSVESRYNSDRYFAYNPYNLTSEDISFDITLVRRPLYFMMNNVFPALLLNVVVILLYTLPFNVQVGACMSHFMTLATYSVRVQTDMSPQAQFVPMVTLYYVLSISYAFVSLIWFIVANNWATKQNIPDKVTNLLFVI